jgi:hypothetical protein
MQPENGGIFNYSPNTGLNSNEFAFKSYFQGGNASKDKVCEVNGKIYGTTYYNGNY